MSSTKPPSRLPDDALLDLLQWETFEYFLHEAHPVTGLVADKTHPDWPASIAATGLALAAYPVGVERGYLTREEAAERTRRTLRFFHDSAQGPGPDTTGYKGFYYHFLDAATGRRAWRSEISTVDTAFLLAGALVAATYFDQETAAEADIRGTADFLYRRANWRWAQDGGATVTHGWRPETGFIPYRWEGYDEALLLYVLALGSPTYALGPESYSAWLSSYVWKTLYEQEFVYAGPLFIHQLSHVWIDTRGIRDAFMRAHDLDYFENSRRATYVQRAYAIQNPREFAHYGEDCWGVTASDGPGPSTLRIDGIEREFYDYIARGVPHGPDDGTLAPWAVVASLPFAPEIVMPAIRYAVNMVHVEQRETYGFKASYNPTYRIEGDGRGQNGWVSPWNFGLNQGPIVLMLENHRTGMLWELTRRTEPMVRGLRRAGFTGGWL